MHGQGVCVCVCVTALYNVHTHTQTHSREKLTEPFGNQEDFCMSPKMWPDLHLSQNSTTTTTSYYF